MYIPDPSPFPPPNNATVAALVAAYGQAHPERVAGSGPAFAFLGRLLQQRYPGQAPTGQLDGAALLQALPASLLEGGAPIEASLGATKQLQAEFQLKPATIRQYRYHLRPFLAWYQASHRPPSTLTVAVAADWQALLEKVAAHTGPGQLLGSRSRLGKLATYATLHRVGVQALITADTERFWQWLQTEGRVSDPRQYYSQIRSAWTKLAAHGVVPPVDFFVLPRKWSRYGIPKGEAVPPLLQAALEDLARRASPGPEADPALRLAASTLDARIGLLRRVLGFVRQEMGVDLETFTLHQLFADPQYLTAFHHAQCERKGGMLMDGHLREMWALVGIGERYVTPHLGPVDLSWLRIYLKRVGPEGQRRSDALGALPRGEVEQVLAAIEAGLARGQAQGWLPGTLLPLFRDRFAMQFYLDHGNRASDLIDADFERELLADGAGYRCRFETKNQPEDEFQLSAAACRVLALYRAHREKMGFNDAAVLITRTGRRLTRQQMYEQVEGWFLRVLHKPYSVHAFRYTFLMEELLRHGDQGLATRRLGNRSVQTTNAFYNRLQPAMAATRWHGLLEQELRGEALVPLAWAQRLLERAASDPQVYRQVAGALRQQGGRG